MARAPESPAPDPGPAPGWRRRVLRLGLAAGATLVAGGAVLWMFAGGRDRPALGPPPPMPAERAVPDPPEVAAEVFLSGLEIVWALAFAPDGRLFLTERPGRIRVASAGGTLDPEPWAVLDDVAHRGESGLMGLALHPDFPREPWVYVMYTARWDGGMVNRVVRLREVEGRSGPAEILLDDLPARGNHSGGRIRFGPDGMLYVGAGEVWQRARAQDLDDPAGSVLRLTPEGRVPDDNPWPANPIWAYGLRNPQGLAWHPVTGALFVADHGPSGEWFGVGGRDEINVMERGANYGWPRAVGAPGRRGLEDPLLAWPGGAPPGDLVFHTGTLIPDLRGDLFFSTLRTEALFRIRFQDAAEPHRATVIERWFVDEDGRSVHGRLRGMTVGPDGALYVGTSNRDGRGQVREGDDRVLRLAPREPGTAIAARAGGPP